MNNAPFEVIANDTALTGESPQYAPAENALYWLDGRRQAVYRIDLASGKRQTYETPSKVNAIVQRGSGGLIAAMKDGVYALDTTSGASSLLLVTEPGRDEQRANDGKVDQRGRFWYGTMEDDAKAPSGNLYRIEADHAFTLIEGGWTVPNGPAWSPDARRFYCADSGTRTIFVYDFDLDSGSLSNKRPFVQLDPKDGVPDGATCDVEGYLWSAHPGSFCVVRYAPDGSEAARIRLPVKRPTSVTFGGPDLRTLYITTASRGLSEAELAEQPLAGAVLSVRVDVPGLVEPVYAG